MEIIKEGTRIFFTFGLIFGGVILFIIYNAKLFKPYKKSCSTGKPCCGNGGWECRECEDFMEDE